MDGEGALNESVLAQLFVGRRKASGVDRFILPGGKTLFAAGAPADTLYFVLTGRLGVLRHDEGHANAFAGVIRSGEPVGEMALIAGTPHTSTVIAIRDSEILSLSREALLSEARRRPRLMTELARLVVLRLRETTTRTPASDPSVFGFVGLEPAIHVRDLLLKLQVQLTALGFSSAVVGQEGETADMGWFTRLEQNHDFLLYAAEAGETAWTEMCSRQVDRLILVGDGDRKPPTRDEALAADATRQHRLSNLVLLHDPGKRRPTGSGDWLDAVNAEGVLHLRRGLDSELARLARFISGTAVALVLSGGGSRAYVHVGAVKALREAGHPIDMIGGCSMGAIIGAGVAMGWTDAEIDERIRAAFVKSSPVADVAFPMIAMTRGSLVHTRLDEHFGDADVADLWTPFFCVSSNLTTGVAQIHRRGPLSWALRASSAVPGVLPPVISGQDVLVDGAVLRNFPADVMRTRHRGPIVGVDVSRSRGLTADEIKGPASIFQWLISGDWLKGPPVVSLLIRSATVSSIRDLVAAREATDLLVQPKVSHIEIRDWKAYDPSVEAGHTATVEALATLDGPLTHLRRRKAEAILRKLTLETEAGGDIEEG